MSRMPIRLRLTLAFACVMAVVLTAIGATIYTRFGADLDATVERSLRSRAADLVSVVSRSGPHLPAGPGHRLIESDETFAQILDGRGRVVDATAGLDRRTLLDTRDLREANTATIQVDRRGVFEPDDPVRLLATPVHADGRRFIVVVGASLEDNEHALASLRWLLLVGMPLALLLASVAGYGVAAGALRPVEAMRRRAAAIGGAQSSERLPVPAAGDEVARLGTTLNDMLARLDEALSRERAFVADASHELRSPLAILRSELELALRSGRSREELEAALRSAAEETDRLNQLADDLLLLARLDRGRLPLRPEAIDVPALLTSVSRRFARRVGEAGRSISVNGAQGVVLEGDRLRFEQAVSNLVENALRHGGGAIHLSAVDRDGVVELHVEDEGPGLPAGFASEAFERFTRGRGSASGAGAGLGLAIVRAVARAHGGSVGARSRAGGGADVYIEIPTAPSVEVPEPVAGRARSRRGLKRKAAIALGGALVVAAGGVGMARAIGGGAADDDRPATGPEAERAKATALRITGGGRANSVERDSEAGATWEVEVTRPDGKTVDVRLDERYRLVVIDAPEVSDEPDDE